MIMSLLFLYQPRGVIEEPGFLVRSVERMVKKYAEIAVPEVKGMHVHSLRSTCATNVYEKSHDLVYTKSLLGHSSVNTTMRYVKDDEKKKKDNRTLLDKDKNE